MGANACVARPQYCFGAKDNYDGEKTSTQKAGEDMRKVHAFMVLLEIQIHNYITKKYLSIDSKLVPYTHGGWM